MIINKINHITLICKDIERTANFLKKIFGATEHYSREKDKFFKIGDVWFVIIEGGPVTKTYNHIAFCADKKDFDKIKQELKDLGLEILEGRERSKEDGDSLYFYDYDDHLFELHDGSLEKRVECFKRG